MSKRQSGINRQTTKTHKESVKIHHKQATTINHSDNASNSEKEKSIINIIEDHFSGEERSKALVYKYLNANNALEFNVVSQKKDENSDPSNHVSEAEQAENFEFGPENKNADLTYTSLTNTDPRESPNSIQIKQTNSMVQEYCMCCPQFHKQVEDDYKAIIREQDGDMKLVKHSLEKLCEKFSETTSYVELFKNIVFNRGEDSKAPIDTVKQLIDQLSKHLTEKTVKNNEQSKELQQSKETNQRLTKKLDSTEKDLKAQINKFEEKSKQQKEILKEKDEENRCMREDFKKKINNSETKYKKLNYYKDQFERSAKELNTKQEMINQLEHELAESTKDYAERILQEQKNVMLLETKLANIQSTISEEQKYEKKKHEEFKEEFRKIAEFIHRFKKKILIDEIKNGAENKFIIENLDKINDIHENVRHYEEQICNFEGSHENKTYLHIKEMLQRAIEKLDSIESFKKEEIQDKKKTTIVYIKQLQNQLESKISDKI